MIKYNNVIEKMKDAGYSSTRIQKEGILSSGTMKALKHGGSITVESIDKICSLLECQPGEIMTWYDEEGGFLFPNNFHIDYAIEDTDDAAKTLSMTVLELDILMKLISSRKKSAAELNEMCEHVSKRLQRTLTDIRSARNNMEKAKEYNGKTYIKN